MANHKKTDKDLIKYLIHLCFLIDDENIKNDIILYLNKYLT